MFEFSDESIMNLIKIINNFPMTNDKSRRLTLHIGSSINKISPDKFMEFIETSYKRINLYFTEHADINQIFDRDDHFDDELYIKNNDLADKY